MVSHYSTVQQEAVTRQDMLQYASKDREDEDCKIVNMEVKNAGFKIPKKSALQMFYEDSTYLLDLKDIHNTFGE